MKKLISIVFAGAFFQCLHAQTADTTPWCPPGATWVYSVLAMGEAVYRMHTYTKDTTVLGRPVKQMLARKITTFGPNNQGRIVEELGFEYYYNSNDSIYFLDNGAFRFIYSFSPQVGDKWITGSTRITCPNPSFPSQDTITVKSVATIVLGNKNHQLIINDSYNRNYLLGNIIKNIGPFVGPYPFVNKNYCLQSSGLFLELVCYSDDVRGIVPVSSTTPFCYGIVTALPAIQETIIGKPFLYPNPVANIIRLKNISISKQTFSVFDAAGRIVSTGAVLNNEVDVASLRPGMYFLRIAGIREKPVVFKFIKL